MANVIRAGVLLLVSGILGCEATSPTPAPIPTTVGDFTLRRIDGNELPQSLTFEGNACSLIASTFNLAEDKTFDWQRTCAAGSAFPGATWGDHPFIQIAVDSIAVPALGYRPPRLPWAHARRKGDSLFLYIHEGSPELGGKHTWLFTRTAQP